MSTTCAPRRTDSLHKCEGRFVRMRWYSCPQDARARGRVKSLPDAAASVAPSLRVRQCWRCRDATMTAHTGSRAPPRTGMPPAYPIVSAGPPSPAGMAIIARALRDGA